MDVISRKEARAAGLKHYFTGDPCTLGGVAERTVSDTKCQCQAHREMRASSARDRYQKNREYRLEKQRRYYRNNRERCLKLARGHYERNREDYISRSLAWQRNNPQAYRDRCRDWARRNLHKVAIHTRNRQARKARATPPWFGEFDSFVLKEAYELAAERSEIFGSSWEVDHVLPIAGKKVCGLHVGANIQVIPQRYNRQKSNCVEEVFAE